MLTRRLLDRLAEIIRRRVEEYHRRLFGTSISGEDGPTASGEDLLPVSVIQLSFSLGKAEAVLKEEEWKQVTWDQLKTSAQVELTETEQRQIEAAELSAYTEFRGLADDIQDGLFQKLAQATGKVVTEAQVRGTIVDKVQLGVEANRSYQTVAAELVGDLKEQKRNWVRVASTEMHSARQRGVAQTIRSGEGVYKDADGDDSRVAVVPAGDACFILGTLVTTKRGSIPIEDVKIGDEVVSHKLRWRRVSRIWRNEYQGKIFGLNSNPCATGNHPYLVESEWRRADSV